MITISLYDVIQSELIKKGFDEFKDEDGNFIFFNEDAAFMTKILRYDEDVQEITDKLFNGLSLKQADYDTHFKKVFLSRFITRQINRQTIDAFKLELMSVFLAHEDFINRVYEDMDKYILQRSENRQTTDTVNDGTTTSDNRQAFADLPQSNVQLDVNDTVMNHATDNTISRNKQTNQQASEGEVTGESSTYALDTLFKSSGIIDQILDIFDERCFLQVW